MAHVKLEKVIENEILNFLRIIGIYCWKNQSIGVYDAKIKAYRRSRNINHIRGVSDILGCVQGRFLAIEVKSVIGRLSEEQRIFLAKINHEGGIAFCARSVEQAASSLLSHFPNNENLKRFAKEYVASGGMDH